MFRGLLLMLNHIYFRVEKSYKMNLNIGTCIFQSVNNVFLNVSDKEKRPEIQELMLDTAVL